MKRPFFSLALLVCSISSLQAAQLYDITLSTAEKFTQCQIKYRGTSMTKFTGKNKKGEEVTKEVKTSSILMMKEVKPAKVAEPEPAAAEPETPAKADASASDSPAEEPAAGEDAPAADGDEGTEGEAAEPETAIPQNDSGDKAKDAAVRLRDKLAKVESAYASLAKPSRAIVSRMKNGKSRIESNLQNIDKNALEVASLQEQYNRANTADFTFEVVPADERDKYVQDGQAAYKAMLIDVQEKKRSRKIAGLDKFEILRERYQGIPEYKEAYSWYIRTLKDLEKKYTDLIAKEDKKRKNLQPAKKAAMEESDREEYEKLIAQLEAQGEDITKVWYTPTPRNRQMLSTCLNKVNDVLRRNANAQLDPAVGTVPSLIEQFWAAMDKARQLMIAGDLDGAEETLRRDPSFNILNRLKTQLLPEEFKSPLRDQRRELDQEIKKRSRDRKELQRKLERQLANLERLASSAEAQIDDLMMAVEQEKDLEAANETTEIDTEQPKEDSGKPADGDKTTEGEKAAES